jgi:hypothetical protein
MGCDFFSAASSPNESGIDKAFYLVWLAGRYRRRFKAWNRRHVYHGDQAGADPCGRTVDYCCVDAPNERCKGFS